MTISVIDYYKEVESRFPLSNELEDSAFNILAYVDGNVRELTLKLSKVKYPSVENLKDFSSEGYKNYIVITDFLLGGNGESVRLSWGLSEEDFRELIFELYFCLVSRYGTCHIFKKAFLIMLGVCKFCMGRKLI